MNRCYVAQGCVKELRSFQRLREDHLRSAAMHVNHMYKALISMNLRLPEVLSQVHGKSGLAMVEAMLAGERDPEGLLALCHSSLIRKKREAILKALEGHYTPEGLFALEQAYQAYQFYQQQLRACDEQIQTVLHTMNQDQDLPDTPQSKRKPIRHHAPQVEELGAHLLTIFEGKDATHLSGITDYSWLRLYAEVGADLQRWPTEKHFTSAISMVHASVGV